MKPCTTSLENELLALSGSNRDGQIVARHFGFDGKGGANFRVIGDEQGLTRERVRQIVLEATSRKRDKRPRSTAVDRAIAVIARLLPARALEIEKTLRAEGLTSRPFRIEGIVSAVTLLDRRSPFSLRRLRGERFVVDAGFPTFPDLIHKARYSVRRIGMASISDLLLAGVDTESGRRERSVVETVLATDKCFRWLDKSTGWFWFTELYGNRAFRRIRKMLCVADSLDIEELRAGLSRMRTELPPDQTLLAFCGQAPGLEVEGGRIRAKSELNRGRILNQTERDICRILTENGGCMSKSDLICRARNLEIKRPTFYQCVSHSPIISKQRGHYSLIGAKSNVIIASGSRPTRAARTDHAC